MLSMCESQLNCLLIFIARVVYYKLTCLLINRILNCGQIQHDARGNVRCGEQRLVRRADGAAGAARDRAGRCFRVHARRPLARGALQRGDA